VSSSDSAELATQAVEDRAPATEGQEFPAVEGRIEARRPTNDNIQSRIIKMFVKAFLLGVAGAMIALVLMHVVVNGGSMHDLPEVRTTSSAPATTDQAPVPDPVAAVSHSETELEKVGGAGRVRRHLEAGGAYRAPDARKEEGGTRSSGACTADTARDTTHGKTCETGSLETILPNARKEKVSRARNSTEEIEKVMLELKKRIQECEKEPRLSFARWGCVHEVMVEADHYDLVMMLGSIVSRQVRVDDRQEGEGERSWQFMEIDNLYVFVYNIARALIILCTFGYMSFEWGEMLVEGTHYPPMIILATVISTSYSATRMADAIATVVGITLLTVVVTVRMYVPMEDDPAKLLMWLGKQIAAKGVRLMITLVIPHRTGLTVLAMVIRNFNLYNKLVQVDLVEMAGADYTIVVAIQVIAKIALHMSQTAPYAQPIANGGVGIVMMVLKVVSPWFVAVLICIYEAIKACTDVNSATYVIRSLNEIVRVAGFTEIASIVSPKAPVSFDMQVILFATMIIVISQWRVGTSCIAGLMFPASRATTRPSAFRRFILDKVLLPGLKDTYWLCASSTAGKTSFASEKHSGEVAVMDPDNATTPQVRLELLQIRPRDEEAYYKTWHRHLKTYTNVWMQQFRGARIRVLQYHSIEDALACGMHPAKMLGAIPAPIAHIREVVRRRGTGVAGMHAAHKDNEKLSKQVKVSYATINKFIEPEYKVSGLEPIVVRGRTLYPLERKRQTAVEGYSKVVYKMEVSAPETDMPNASCVQRGGVWYAPNTEYDHTYPTLSARSQQAQAPAGIHLSVGESDEAVAQREVPVANATAPQAPLAPAAPPRVDMGTKAMTLEQIREERAIGNPKLACQLTLANIPSGTTVDDMEPVISRAGPVITRRKRGGKCHVMYHSSTSVEKALAEGMSVRGVPLTLSRPQTDLFPSIALDGVDGATSGGQGN